MRIAVIPARGGSKRIPRKNIKPFSGQPMIAWTIAAAKKSAVFDRIIVSTDDEEIAAIARQYGAETPFVRPPELSDDHTATTAVIAHTIDYCQQQGISLDAVCCLYATAPFIQAEDIEKSYHQFCQDDWDYCFTVTDFPAPVFRSFKALNTGGVEMFYPEHFNTRSQDLPEALHDAGQFYWGTAQAWLDNKVIFSERSRVYKIPRWRVQDIDTEDDWQRAELMAPVLLGKPS
ncbi:pseudaminic acid cytidylyltransferase [Bacterioplanoides sp.]|uniref:pseudaminic acid cytidylyltransferase n=1 Tax=Bacterioplanoides sp. TaxID=2066072 RepID=UPI003AFFC92A